MPRSLPADRGVAARISMYHAPTMVKQLINSPSMGGANTSNLRTLIYGGSHMYLADLQRSLEILGPKLVQIYGQGESPNTITLLDKSEHARTDLTSVLCRLPVRLTDRLS